MFTLRLMSFFSRPRRRRTAAVVSAACLVSTESLAPRVLLSATSEPRTGTVDIDNSFLLQERKTSATSIQERRFVIQARKESGFVTSDNAGFEFSRDASELILRIMNHGQKGASVTFKADDGSAPIKVAEMPRNGRIPAGEFDRMVLAIPTRVIGDYSGVLTLHRGGENGATVTVPIRAKVEAKATLQSEIGLSADQERVYYDFGIQNTGNGNGLLIDRMTVKPQNELYSGVVGWQIPDLQNQTPLAVNQLGTFRVAAGISRATTRNVQVTFETNGGTVTKSINLQEALDRLNPVLAAKRGSVDSSASNKTITVSVVIRNSSIRDPLTISPGQIQVLDSLGVAIPPEEIAGGLPTQSLTIAANSSITLKISLRTNPELDTNRYRGLQVYIQSNGGEARLQWDLNSLIDRLPATLEFGEVQYKEWDRYDSRLQYSLVLKNTSIRDALTINMAAVIRPQQVSLKVPRGATYRDNILTIASEKSVTITVEIFTDVQKEVIDSLKQFELRFPSNDPRGNGIQAAGIDASKQLKEWRDSRLVPALLPIVWHEVVYQTSFEIMNKGDRSVTIALTILAADQGWIGYVEIGGTTLSLNQNFILKPNRKAKFTVAMTPPPSRRLLSFKVDPIDNSQLEDWTFNFYADPHFS